MLTNLSSHLQHSKKNKALFRIIMAQEPKSANINIRQTARVFDEQAFADGVFNDDNILVVGCGVILDRQ